MNNTEEALEARLIEIHNITHESRCDAIDNDETICKIDVNVLGELQWVVKLYSSALQRRAEVER